MSAQAAASNGTSGPIKVPFTSPVPSVQPPPPAELTADQKAKYDKLLEEVKAWKEIPAKDNKGGPITDAEIMWLTRECLLRYLRATKWNQPEATKRLLGSLTWRREYGVEELTGDYISPEQETGKQLILGYDIAGRPCQFLNPGKQNTETSPRQVQHLVFMLERVIDMMVPGQESLALLINFKGNKGRSNTAPGIGQGREVLNILQTHYPERLGRAIIINIPWVVNGFFKLITPFIDPLTREKLKFNEDARKHVPPEQLQKEAFGGDVDFEYDHSVYWPALLRICEERRAERKARWEKAGKRYGEDENYLKGAPSKEPSPESVQADLAKLDVKDEQPAATEEKPVKAKSDVKEETSASPEGVSPGEGEAPKRTIASESNGNTDVLAVTKDPVLTTEGDRE